MDYFNTNTIICNVLRDEAADYGQGFLLSPRHRLDGELPGSVRQSRCLQTSDAEDKQGGKSGSHSAGNNSEVSSETSLLSETLPPTYRTHPALTAVFALAGGRACFVRLGFAQ